MCEPHPLPSPARLNRRHVLGLATGVLGAAIVGGAQPAATLPARPYPVQVMPGLFVRPRELWGADLPPKGPIFAETPQFLLVHHTASPNAYPAGGAREVIRTTYAWHTSSAKGWPDVCYEFFVDHDGAVWEGRAGALSGPVQGDATGGSQGFAQLVCLVGDFTSTDPSPAMLDALVKVLAWLANRSAIDTSPGATTTFVSRGSQRYPPGATVTTPTIAGHRDMSFTTCPGDHMYFLLENGLREQVHAQRLGWQGALFQAQRLGPASP